MLSANVARSSDVARPALSGGGPGFLAAGESDFRSEKSRASYHRCMSRIGDFADDDVAGGSPCRRRSGKAMAAYSHAVYNRNRLPMRVREIARIVIAHDNECVVCEHPRRRRPARRRGRGPLRPHALR